MKSPLSKKNRISLKQDAHHDSSGRSGSSGGSSSNKNVTFRTRPIIVVEEDEVFDSNNNHNNHYNNHDVIPGPESALVPNNNNNNALMKDGLGLSATEHYKRGDGILASIKDIGLPPSEFAAGCNLLQAAAMGDRPAMEALLQVHPSHVDFRDYDRRTALHVAASEGHLHICQYLVTEMGARINRSDRWGGSPLDDAHRHRHEAVVVFLRHHGATTGSSDHTSNLITAAAEGDVNEIKLLLQFATHQVINGGDYDRRTPLHLAAGEGRVEIVKLLLEADANPNAQDRWGGRPLDDAVRHDKKECVALLKKYGAEPGKLFASLNSNSNSSNVLDTSGSIRKREQANLMVNFDDLEMIERIGAGAFGEIYKCKWRGTLVAAKCIKTAKIRKNWLLEQALNRSSASRADAAMDQLLLDEDNEEISQHAKDLAIADFRQETAILRSLRHPNICLLLAYSTTADYEVMISELMMCSLLDIFKANLLHNRRMPKKMQIAYAQQLAQGMNYLHTCKPPVIHRDLKPANLLIDASGVLKVADFGLAKVRPDPKPNTTAEDGPPAPNDFFAMTGETGSYRFMAPEVYRRQFYNETVDIYSYAMIFYYLLSGKPPWPTLAGYRAVAKAVEGERPNIPRDWDVRLSNLLQQCWDENPQKRPPFDLVLDRLSDYSRDVFKTDPNASGTSAVVPTSAVHSKCACTIM